MEGEIQDESGEDCDPLEEVAGATLESIRWPTATGECWRGWLYMSAKQFRRGLKQRSQIEAIRPNAWRNHPKKSARAYHVAPRVVERNPAAHLSLNMPAKPKLRALLVSHLKRFQKGFSRKLAPCSPPKKYAIWGMLAPLRPLMLFSLLNGGGPGQDIGRRRLAIYITVVGAGGTGGYFGGLLARAGQDVTFIARGAHLAALRTRA